MYLRYHYILGYVNRNMGSFFAHLRWDKTLLGTSLTARRLVEECNWAASIEAAQLRKSYRPVKGIIPSIATHRYRCHLGTLWLKRMTAILRYQPCGDT